MRYGVCCGLDLAPLVAEVGFDFVELSVGSFLKPREDEAAFQEVLREVRALSIPWEASNGFLPGDLKLTGPDADPAAQREYVTTACRRAGEAGVRTIVFGSGAARCIPEGFGRDAAHEQLVSFLRMLGPIAQEHGVVIAIEPLNGKECNVLTSVGEAAAFATEAGHPAIRVLVDAYHWMTDDNSAEDIVDNGSLIVHTHIATKSRKVPGAEECDFAPFFDALKRGGYDGRVSTEAGMADPPTELPRALEVLRSFG